MRLVRLPIMLAALLACGACGGISKKAPGDPEAAPDCQCAGRVEDGCGCPHCMSSESGMEPAACPCAERGYK